MKNNENWEKHFGYDTKNELYHLNTYRIYVFTQPF